jgi:haloacetate dehalogenase
MIVGAQSTIVPMTASFFSLPTFGIERDGVRIHGRIGGRGAPLLLLHGHPQTHAIWHRVAPALAERFTVVAIDLRGYGDSGRPPADAEHAATASARWRSMRLPPCGTSGFERFGCWRTTAARASPTASRPTIPAPSSACCCSTSRPRWPCTSHTSEAFAKRLLALVLPDPAAAAARGADRVRPGALRAQRDGRPACRPRAFRARDACRVRALRAHRGHRRVHLRGLPRQRHHRPRARPRRHRCRQAARAAAARAVGRTRRGGQAFDVLALWRERAADVSAARCRAATTFPKKPRTNCSPRRWTFFHLPNHDPVITLEQQ